jgi:3',5'-cyclic AMP phosphodiesterase CpdA
MTHARILLPASLALVLGCARLAAAAPGPATAEPAEPPLVTVAAAAQLTFIAYGDTRFTAPTEASASWPRVRQALVARIAAERPAAILLSGDLVWHGGTLDDYRVYREETAAWRSSGIRVLPATGNHEYSQCEESQCLENWWGAFPELRGHRWYAAALGTTVYSIALDSLSSLLAGSPQRAWLERQIAALPTAVRFVLITLHHPPVDDPQDGPAANHNVRPNEQALADYLRAVAPGAAVRFIVNSGHVHNYERFEQDGVVYLVTGGGGAQPVEVRRAASDRYQDAGFPNFHYLRFTLSGDRLSAEMLRLADYDAASPARFEVQDRFVVIAKQR